MTQVAPPCLLEKSHPVLNLGDSMRSTLLFIFLASLTFFIWNVFSEKKAQEEMNIIMIHLKEREHLSALISGERFGEALKYLDEHEHPTEIFTIPSLDSKWESRRDNRDISISCLKAYLYNKTGGKQLMSQYLSLARTNFPNSSDEELIEWGGKVASFLEGKTSEERLQPEKATKVTD